MQLFGQAFFVSGTGDWLLPFLNCPWVDVNPVAVIVQAELWALACLLVCSGSDSSGSRRHRRLWRWDHVDVISNYLL